MVNAAALAMFAMTAQGLLTPSPPPPADPDFSLSSGTVVTAWGTVVVGDLVPVNAPAGAYFVLVDEPAGLAVVNG